jgi:hypothetical protein
MIHEMIRRQLKTCTVCGNEKPLDDFYKKEATSGRLRAWCKDCTNNKSITYRQRNKGHVNRLNRLRYYKNKPTIRATQRKYEQKIKELMRTDKIWHSKELIGAARHRAKKYDVPFSITYRDIPIPDVCPVLGIRLERNKGKMSRNSATVDRVIPELGYVPGNVIVVSLKANNIKNDATPEEILSVGEFYRELRDGKTERNVA